METLEQRMQLIDRHVARCAAALATEPKASPVLLAVFRELERKVVKFKGVMNGDAQTAREHLVETEQAADSMRVAALADPGLTPATVELATIAHDSLCVFKHEWHG